MIWKKLCFQAEFASSTEMFHDHGWQVTSNACRTLFMLRSVSLISIFIQFFDTEMHNTLLGMHVREAGQPRISLT